MEEKVIWNIIDCYFNTFKNFAVKHHLDSYNTFFNKTLPKLIQEKNPISFYKEREKENYNYQCFLYMGGKNGTKIYYGKPIIYDESDSRFMYPNEARLRNMTYGFSIHYDVDVDFIIRLEKGIVNKSITLKNIFLGRFPIMLQSNMCILNGLAREVRYTMGECRNDWGGYFIIDGKEKVIVSQEKFADNMLYIRDKVNDTYSHSAEIRSVSEDISKPIRTLAIRIVSPTAEKSNGHLVVNIPNVRLPVPLFIVMRALGVISDKKIMEYCLLNLDKYSDYLELFRPSVHDAGKIFTQTAALKYIASFTKGKTTSAVLEILSIYFLPHIGELNFKRKALYLGYIVKELLDVFTKKNPATDRDNFKFKRIESAGNLIYQLFREYYNLQLKDIYQKIDKEYYYHRPSYQDIHFLNLIENNQTLIFSNRIVEIGFKKAFKGNWGAQSHTKRLGIVQDLNRLSYFSFSSHLRKVNVPLDSSAKVVGPRLLHNTQWGKQCPIHTPDGGNVGLHKHFSVMAHITSGYSYYSFIEILRNQGMVLLEESSPLYIFQGTKVFMNGAWVGIVNKPESTINYLRLYRRNGLVPIFTGLEWNILKDEIHILTDGGRLMRPIFYMLDDKVSWDRDFIKEKIERKSITWEELIYGFNAKKGGKELLSDSVMKAGDYYAFGDNMDQLKIMGSVIEYIDTQEEESTLIAIYSKDIKEGLTTHVEIHPSLILSIMANQIIFPENNPFPRDSFSCGQSKQAVSLYATNYQNRIDKMGIVLHYGQIPLVKSKFLKYVSSEEHPYGINATVAIMCYTGYNVEDAIIINKGALDRGLFRTTYFNMYESREESSEVHGSKIDSKFCNIYDTDVVKIKSGYDYSYLDKHGLIKENTKMHDKIVMIGKCIKDLDKRFDNSVVPKRGQLGYVDKSFMTDAEAGFRISKVRIRHERIPAIGDKFCSRAGQKGTIGLVLPEADMPFTKDGIRPDIIVNPHAFPSRMTIGHLIESIMGKASSFSGYYGNCTAFMNKGLNNDLYGDILISEGFHPSGTEILNNGFNGMQIEADIYIGPTYYLRLKHMVKDKINYRAGGPKTMLTRQPVQGRANNGGLRIGEMDRDAVIAAGMSKFLNESFMDKCDKYQMGICNISGTIAIYNKTRNVFISPMCDGPIQFDIDLEGNLNLRKISRFGRNFSLIDVPYAFKLLYQELLTMNIQMRLITEDNVEKMTSMINSNNILKISKFKSILEVQNDNINKISGENKEYVPRQRVADEQELEEKETESVEREQGEELEDAEIVFKTKKACEESVHFKAFSAKYPNVRTDIPYALDVEDLLKMVVGNLIASPVPLSEFIKNEDVERKLNIDFFQKWSSVSKRNTLDYLFNKIRSGYFVQIQGGVLKQFLPFYNVKFKNTWSHLLNIENLKNPKINENRSEWTATNCLIQLTFKPLTDVYNMDTFLGVKHMFIQLCENEKIPDIDLFINVKDFPLLKKDLTEPFHHIYNSRTKTIDNPKKLYYPILSFNSNEDFTDIPIPTNHEWSVVTQQIFPSRCLRDYKYPTKRIMWKDKLPTAVFRGTATGCTYIIEDNPRLYIAKLDRMWNSKKEEVPLLDAGITKFANRFKTKEGSTEVIYWRDKPFIKNMREQISIKKFISMANQCKYKYIVNIPGNSAAYRLSYLLRSGSVILNVESENKLWWESKWKPMEHYVPVMSDLTDLKEKIEWCRTNDAKCKEIVKNAEIFANKYITKEYIFNYLKSIIQNILRYQGGDTPNVSEERQKYKVKIIVPFRDTTEQKIRMAQLELFKKRMVVFIPKVVELLKTRSIDGIFDIIIVEQTKEHSFNRGALLNIGFKTGDSYDCYIFHDVDLLPEDSMIPIYAGPYHANSIVHLASEWNRYKNPYKYLGGVLLVGKDMFQKANGFPNNYFGWGGEDDELRRRFETSLGGEFENTVRLLGKPGGLKDLENIGTAREKLEILTDKNQVRWEGADNHKTTWETNGLNQEGFYEIIQEREHLISKIKFKTLLVKLNLEQIKPFAKVDHSSESK
uniref:DNA-directed RNA polymerase subunit beta n=1 Tax=uncultured marine group II/III euryarchaeote AD1000_88_G11 TaxID=1457822 RepID=A0A075G076_9EURY|nr:DNA-directed RNA polymerase subunit B (RPB2, POLR2B) [uncultured marine group II/III euryarchaeote AD1000_88_G11]